MAVPYNLVTTSKALREVADAYASAPAFVFDVETIGDDRGDPFRNKVAWLILATKGRTDVIPLSHPNGDYLRTDYPLLLSGQKKVAAGKQHMLTERDYSRDERKGVRVFGPPPTQLLPADVFAALRPAMFGTALKGGHNFGFDLQSVAKYYGGEIPAGPYFCTMWAAHVLDSRHANWLGLDDCLKREFGHIMKKGVGKNVALHSFQEVADYGAGDAAWTWKLMLRYRSRLKEEGGNKAFRVDMDILPVTCSMELAGVQIDVVALRDLKAKLDIDLESAKAKVFVAAGKAFPLNSNPVKQQLLYGPKAEGGRALKPKKYTPAGVKVLREGGQLEPKHFAVSAEALEFYRDVDPLATALLEYADLNKLMTTYVVPYLGGEVERTTAGKTKTVQRASLMYKGRIHTRFAPITETGRFASRNPNLQNVPNPRTTNGKAVRNLFCCEDDEMLVVADYSQIEPRVTAEFTGESRLVSCYQNGEDIYTTIADPFGLPRNAGKTLFLALSYGVGPDKIAASIGLPLTKAKSLLRDFEEEFRTIYQYKSRLVRQAVRIRPVPYVETLLGRRRYLPDLRLPDTRENYGYRSRAQRQAFNCVDLETEILTRRGWVRGDDLILGEEALTKNAETGALEWQPVRDIKMYTGEVPLVSIESKSFSALTTPNHRWLVTNRSRRNQSEQVECKTTSELSRYGDHRIHRTGTYVSPESVLKDDFVRLAGWFLTDGCIIKANNGAYLCQSARAKPHHVAAIDDLLLRLDVKFTRRVNASQVVYWNFHDGFADALRINFPDRMLTARFLSLLTREQAQILINVMLDGDGHRGKDGGATFTCAGKEQADLFQFACVLAGKATTSKWRDMSMYKPTSELMSNSPRMTGVWTVYVMERDKVHVQKKHVTERVEQDFTVWCPVVDNTYFVARRDGKVYVTGNTKIQGSAADIMKIAMIRAHALIPEEAQLVLTVHDEIVTTCPKRLADETAEAIREAMEGVRALGSVPLVADVKIVKTWGDAK